MVLRLLLDVNVWVNHYLALSRGKQGSAAQRLVNCAFQGHCRLGPVQPIISYKMIDTLQGVLVDIGLSEIWAMTASVAIEAAASDGVVEEGPHIVLGGGTFPLMDDEDRAVLETALAGGADLLVTNNLKDFTPGPRTDLDADMRRLGQDGKPDVLLLRHPMSPDGIVIASVFAASSWLLDGQRPPSGILSRFHAGDR